MKRMILALAAFGLLIPTSAFAVGKITDGESAFLFELRALGGHVGDAVLSIGKSKKVGKRLLRPVRIDARTGGLATKVMKTEVAATEWVDEGSWLPVRARWDAEDKKGKRVVKARYDGNRVRGEDFRNGQLKRKTDQMLAQAPNGLVSVFTWLLHQDTLVPGRSHTSPVYDGRRVYDASFKVSKLEQIHLPVGIRKALRVDVSVTRKDKPDFKKEITFWIDPADRTPYRLAFSYGLLGDVVANLTGKKT